MRELLRVDLREKYRDTLFEEWSGRNLPAQHWFVPTGDPCKVRMSLTHPGPLRRNANCVIESTDGGETWERTKESHIPANRGIFRFGQHMMAMWSGTDFWRSSDAGVTWYPGKIENAGELIYDGLGAPNCFSAIMIERGTYTGRIVLVSDYFLGQEGPDGEVLASTYSDDWGATWHSSKVFGSPDPLPSSPEGFGEPAVVQLPCGWLWMVFRSLYGELWQCISRDGGASWGRPSPTGLVSPIANCYAVREPTTGSTVLAWNAAVPNYPESVSHRELARPRTNLVFAVSHDNTRTWTVPVVVEPSGGQYPTIHFAAGRMFIMYQSSSQDGYGSWENMGLTSVAYDTEEVLSLPAWTPETLRPWVDAGLVRHWRVVSCTPTSRETAT